MYSTVLARNVLWNAITGEHAIDRQSHQALALGDSAELWSWLLSDKIGLFFFLKKIFAHLRSDKESIALYPCSQAMILGIDTYLCMSVSIVYTNANILLYAVHAYMHIYIHIHYILTVMICTSLTCLRRTSHQWCFLFLLSVLQS